MNILLQILYKKKYKILLFLFLACSFGLLAQEDSEEGFVVDETYQIDRFMLSGGLARMIPQGQFVENIERRYGGNFAFYTRISRRFPLFLGLDAGTYTLDRYSENYFLTDDEGFIFEVRERTNSKLLNMHLVLRAQPYFDFFLHPYAEAFVGGRHLYARTVVTDLNPPDGNDSTISNDGQFGEWTISAGGAIGLNFPLTMNATSGIELDLKCIYLKGGIANYNVLQEEIDFSNYNDTYDAFELKNSTTDLLIIQLGLIIYFGG